MNLLKSILQSKIFWIILGLFLILDIIVFTKIIKYESKISKDISSLTGRVEKLKIDGDKLSITLNSSEKVVAVYYISSEDEKNYLEENLKIGSIVTLEGKKQELLSSTIFNTFNYQNYLYNSRIYLSFLATNIEINNNYLTILDKIKDVINKRMGKIDKQEYSKAFILGDKNDMDTNITNIIKSNGVSHLFALSGMHVNFVWLFLKKLKLNNILIFVFLLMYYFIAGCPISFLRALLFMLFLKLNKKFKFNLSNIQVLIIVASLIIIKDPFVIYNVAFIYTFVVTFSLLLYSKYIKIKGYFKNAFFVSSITFLFSLPITLSLNYEINLFSPLFNIVLVPYVSLIVFPLTILTFFAPLLNPIYSLCILILENVNLFFNNISIILVVGKISIIEIVLYYIFLILVLVKRKFLYVFLALLVVLFMRFKYFFDNNYYAYFLDVGQGDSAVLISPKHQEVVMIDTGGKISYSKEDFQIRKNEFNLADNISMFLKSLGINKIDLLILSHGDLDHAGYTLDLLKQIKIKKVLFNADEKNDLELKISLNIQEVNVIDLNFFNFISLDTGLYDNENDNSQVLYFKIYNKSFLFMGDASIKVEENILKKYKLQADIIKLGHHGSKTSSSYNFLEKINPNLAIISAGRSNRYGHPNQEVIDNLNSLNINYLNTQESGSIMIKIGKNNYHVLKCLS